MAKKGLIIVISGPSGAGKTTVCKEILKRRKNTVFSVSVTTRKPRNGEIDGKDYFFISEKKFKRMLKNNELIEWAFVHNNYYGTPKKFLHRTINSGKDIILDIDVQGGMKIKKFFPEGIFIFLMPSSWKVLEQRIRKRAQDDEKTIKVRLKNAKKEISYISDYTYFVINDKLENAVKSIISIIEAEHRKISRLKDEIKSIVQRTCNSRI